MNHDIQVPERHECDALMIGGGPERLGVADAALARTP
jgi:hypothetical protein